MPKEKQKLELYSNDAEVSNETQNSTDKKLTKKQKAIIAGSVVAIAALGGVAAYHLMQDNSSTNPSTPIIPDPDNPNTPVDPDNPNPDTPNPDNPNPDNPNTPDPDFPQGPTEPEIPEQPDPDDTSEYGQFLTDMYNNQYFGLVCNDTIKQYIESYNLSGFNSKFEYVGSPDYYLTSNEENYNNYYDLLKDLGQKDLNKAKEIYNVVLSDVQGLIDKYSNQDLTPNGYISTTSFLSNKNMLDQLNRNGSLCLTKSDLMYLDVTDDLKESNDKYYHATGKDLENLENYYYITYNSQFLIDLDLAMHDYLPQNIQNWRVNYWGFDSEEDYKQELSMQYKRIELIKDAVSDIPMRSSGTSWQYASDNITPEESRIIKNIAVLGLQDIVDHLKDDKDIEAFNKIYPVMFDCFAEEMQLFNKTFKDPDKSLESYFTDENKQEVRNLINSIQNKINYLYSEQAANNVLQYLPEIVTYAEAEEDYSLYIIPANWMEEFLDIIKQNSYIQEMLKDNSTIVDMREMNEDMASKLSRPFGTKIVGASKLNDNSDIYLLKMLDDAKANSYEIDINGKKIALTKDEYNTLNGIPVPFTEEGDYIIKSRSGAESAGRTVYSQWSYPQNFIYTTPEKVAQQAVDNNVADLIKEIKKRKQQEIFVNAVSHKNDKFSISGTTKDKKPVKLSIDLSKHCVDSDAKNMFDLAYASSTLLSAYKDGAKVEYEELDEKIEKSNASESGKEQSRNM